MGEPVRIADMARQLVYMTGNVPDVDIPIVYTGLRPGEKLYEELLINDAECKTRVEGITIAHPTLVSFESLRSRVEDLMLACETQSLAGMVRALKALVPEWTASIGLAKHLEAPISARLRTVAAPSTVTPEVLRRTGDDKGSGSGEAL